MPGFSIHYLLALSSLAWRQMPPLVLLLAVMAYRSTGGGGMSRPAPLRPDTFPQEVQGGRGGGCLVVNAQKPTRCTERPSLAHFGQKKRSYYFFPRLPDCYFSTALQIRSSAGFGTDTAHRPSSALKFPPQTHQLDRFQYGPRLALVRMQATHQETTRQAKFTDPPN